MLFGRLTSSFQYRPIVWRRTPATWIKDLVVLTALFYILLWNGRVLHRKKTYQDAPDSVMGRLTRRSNDLLLQPGSSKNWLWVGDFTRLGQSWNMFAPKPTQIRGWFVVKGEFKDGPSLDLYKVLVLNKKIEEAELTWERPGRAIDLCPNARWRKYMMHFEPTPKTVSPPVLQMDRSGVESEIRKDRTAPRQSAASLHAGGCALEW